MTEEYAKWNIKYLTDGVGKSLKISDMSINQVNNSLRICKTKTQVILKQMEGLYQRRYELLKDTGYELKNAKMKMAQTIGIKKGISDKKGDRLQQILITALDFLQKGKSIELVEAILIQAKEEFD